MSAANAARGETVAFLGAGGMMGMAMARNLLRAGIEVRAWNRTTRKAQPLGPEGAEVLDGAQDAVRGASLIVTMLADGDAVLETMGAAGLGEGAEQAAVWVQMGTIGLENTARCEELARECGIAFVDAPVLGTVKPAEEGELVILAACAPEEQLRARLGPLFDALGQRTIWLDRPGAGSRLKLVANSWVLTVVEGCAEAFALAEGLDLDPALLLEAVAGGTLDLPYLQMKGRAILQRDFQPAFRLALAAKDAGLVERAARDRGLDLPLFSAIHGRLRQGVAEHGEQDMIATYCTSAPRAAGAAR